MNNQMANAGKINVPINIRLHSTIVKSPSIKMFVIKVGLQYLRRARIQNIDISMMPIMTPLLFD